ncbi:MAG: hypothetical protein QNJ23_01765 [Woeseiaceae bacterium]|nr:hypothetical protein [Woeseiaceae bacterium]
MTYRIASLALAWLLAACAPTEPVIDTTTPSFVGAMPVDFSGSWERDYSRGEDVQGALNTLFRERQRIVQQQSQFPGSPRQSSGISQREANALVALARLVEEITRPDVLTISQDDYEIRVARKDDFDLSCSFFEGIAQGTDSAYGTEVCSWDGDSLVSHLVLPGGLTITHRFTMSPDGNYLRVITTAKSGATRTPFTLHRFYIRFEAPPSAFNCIETLSMKRVCSTGEVGP